MPYFSVITPSFNQGEYLEACIRSVELQGDPDFEHRIIDNCSTDETAAVAARHPGVIFESKPDRGQAHAVNLGLAASTGEIICWLNADDELAPECFARLRKAFADPSVAVVFGDALQVEYPSRNAIRAPAAFANRLDLIRWWSPAVKLHQPSIFFRRSVLAEVGYLREDLHYALDYEFWWRLSERFAFRQLPEVLAVQHRQPDSKTMRAWNRVLTERERIFSPFYSLLPDPVGLEAERRNCLAQTYLTQAFFTAADSPAQAWGAVRAAFAQSPRRVLRPTTLGIFRRMLTGRQGA